jgi:hypothetical protein
VLLSILRVLNHCTALGLSLKDKEDIRGRFADVYFEGKEVFNKKVIMVLDANTPEKVRKIV